MVDAVAANLQKARLTNYSSELQPSKNKVSKELQNHFTTLNKIKKEKQRKRYEAMAETMKKRLGSVRPSVASVGELSIGSPKL